MRDSNEIDGGLRLPFPHPPNPGEVIEIAPDLLWARMPLPMRLNHVNVWLLRDKGRWTAVDCGADTVDTRNAWDALLGGPLGGEPLERLVATHGHPDHIGCSGWIASRAGIPFFATLASWLWARIGHANVGAPARPESLRHLESHGADPSNVAAFAENHRAALRLFGEQPAALVRLRDGDQPRFGGSAWTVHTADGHADEHATFHSIDRGVLIAGDQILQRISPMIGVFALEPRADPLTDYLRSLDHYAGLPDETLVLPSHGLPFYGIGTRVRQLKEHHAHRLAITLDALDSPRTATQCAHRIFERAMAEGQWFLALAETLAHLHHLVTQGVVVRQVDESGLVRFSRG
jgi:glyoxylase-like metal-dependent hydrolase (beta-lactamase superfamily II)